MSRPGDQDWHLDGDGWLSGVQHLASPNFDERPPHTDVCLVVLHSISLPPGTFTGNAVTEFFTNRLNSAEHAYFRSISRQRVSAHFFIRRDGTVIQLVSCSSRAWHAGVSCWRGRERCNDFSIGIEIEGDDYSHYEKLQYRSLVQLLDLLQRHYPIAAVISHADIAPGRKTDPGPYFDWSCIPNALRG